MAGVKVRQRGTWVVRAALAVVVAAAGLPALSTTASAVSAPNGLTPSGGPGASPSPVLSGAALLDATSYDVEVAVSSSFTTPLFTKTTTNRQIVPTVHAARGHRLLARACQRSAGASAWVTADDQRSLRRWRRRRLAPANDGPALDAAARPAAALLDRRQGRDELPGRGRPRRRLHRRRLLHHQDDVAGRA